MQESGYVDIVKWLIEIHVWQSVSLILTNHPELEFVKIQTTVIEGQNHLRWAVDKNNTMLPYETLVKLGEVAPFMPDTYLWYKDKPPVLKRLSSEFSIDFESLICPITTDV